MAIPFDPHELDPEEYGETQTTIEIDDEMDAIIGDTGEMVDAVFEQLDE